MSDYSQVHLAGLALPLTAATDNSLLQDADPALYWFTQWCKGVIQIHCGPRWDAEVTRTGLPALVGSVVKSTAAIDPVPYWQQANYPLPLLAVYRVGSRFSSATMTWTRRGALWELDYVLPPLSASQLERLSPFRAAIEAALYDRTTHDADPNVLDGQRLSDLMQTESIRVLDTETAYTVLQVAQRTPGTTVEHTLFPLLHMKFEVAERRLPDTYPSITGVDTTVSTPGGLTIAQVENNFPWP